MQQAEKAILNGEVTLSNLRHALSEVVNTRAKLEEAQTDLEANDAKQKVRPFASAVSHSACSLAVGLRNSRQRDARAAQRP